MPHVWHWIVRRIHPSLPPKKKSTYWSWLWFILEGLLRVATVGYWPRRALPLPTPPSSPPPARYVLMYPVNPKLGPPRVVGLPLIERYSPRTGGPIYAPLPARLLIPNPPRCLPNGKRIEYGGSCGI